MAATVEEALGFAVGVGAEFSRQLAEGKAKTWGDGQLQQYGDVPVIDPKDAV